MWKIFYTVKNIFDYSFKDASDEFKEGFRRCFMLFEVGYEKTNLTPLKSEYYKLLEEHERLSTRFVHEQRMAEQKIQKLNKQNMLLEEKVKRLIGIMDGEDEIRMAG